MLAIIEALGGDSSTNDHHPCPVCGGRSLSVKNGDKLPVVVYCHKCGKEGGPAIIDKLRARGVWPTSSKLEQGAFKAQQKRSAKERRNYAVDIWNDLRKSGGRERASLLREYLHGRCIKKVPSTALAAIPIAYQGSRFGAPDPGLVLPVRDRDGKLQGIQVTWLSPDMKLKRKAEPQRQSYGLIKGNFVALTDIDFANPPPTLLIGEGTETVLAAMQVTKLPGIATAGAGMMKDLDPPRCAEYIICADAGTAGITAASALAQRLTVRTRIAVPNGPDGYDWNDALRDGASAKALKDMILSADVFQRNERPLTIRAVADFETMPLDWFWEPFIPLAMVTVVFGDGGVGKSTTMLELIHRVTRGERMPLSEGDALSGSALILTKEDDINRVVRPRLEAAGADLTKVHIVGYDVPDDPKEFDTLVHLDSNIAELEQIIVRLGDVRIVVLDPASDFCGKIDPNDEKQVRDFLTPLTSLARRYNIAVVIIVHVNKDTMQAAHHRGLGSVAWRNVPRAALLVADDPDVGGRKVLVQTKANLTEFGESALGFTMQTVEVGGSRYSVIEWEDELCDVDLEKLMSKRKPKTKLEQAKELLQELLQDGSKPREEIKYMAEGEGISWRTSSSREEGTSHRLVQAQG